MKKNVHKPDYLLVAYFGILVLFGLAMLMSASSVVGFDHFGDSYFFVKRQLLFGLLPGVIMFFFLAKFPYRILKKISTPVFIGVIILLILTFIPPIGTGFGTGANSWINLGNFSFQPAELAKLGLIIFMAAFVSSKGKAIQSFKNGFLPVLALGCVPLILVLAQPDIGTAAILFIILFGLIYVGHARLLHLGFLLGSGVGLFLILIAKASYRMNRLLTFMHPELDPQGVGYHINQAFLAIGSGGLFGLGLGHSRQKFQYLPEVHADSIFAIIAEEMGFFIAVGVIILLLLICYKGLMIAKQAPDGFGKLLVSGIIIWFIAQSFLNIGAMVGLLPITGVPLPFVSHGGTALMVGLAAAGIMVNVSKYTT